MKLGNTLLLLLQLTWAWCYTVGHLQMLQSDPWQAWHFSHPFLTFFSSHHPKNILDRHCGSGIKTLLKPHCEGDNELSQKHILQVQMSQTSLSWGVQLQLKDAWRHLNAVVPATPINASLSFTILGPVVVSKILHGEGVLTQRLLILTVLAPDFVKVAHWGKKQNTWNQDRINK